MKYIKNNIIYAFDLDNTLIYNKNFENQVNNVLFESFNLKNKIFKELSLINKNINDINFDNGRIFVKNVDNNLLKNTLWVKKKDRYYLTTPENFFLYDEGIPDEINYKILKIYNSSINKCIITIRKEKYRYQTINLLNELSIEIPNSGLYMYPYNIIKDKAEWKSHILKTLLSEYNSVIYFDDDIKILKRIKKILEGENIDLYNIKNNNLKKIN